MRTISILLLIVGLAWLLGCGGPALQVDPVDPMENPSNLIRRMGQEIAAAKEDGVDVLSPTWFRKAQASHARAQKGLEQGAAADAILEHIARARAELQQADVVAIRCRDQLEETIQSREAARAVDAQQFGTAYASAEEAFLKLTQALEDGEFEYARQNRKAATETFRALELRAIDHAALSDVRALLAQAEQSGVPQDAPNSFAQAREAMAQAEAHIAANRYDQGTIRLKADTARFMTQRAMTLAQTSRKLEEMAPEEIALWIESMLSETSTRLKTEDRRNQPFEQQQEAILAGVAALQSASNGAVQKEETIQKLMGRMADLEGSSQQARLDAARLAAEKRFNETFSQVQEYFRADEAEVYKQKDQLVIRLKGMRFGVGKSEITPENYDLLAKVQKAIAAFGKPQVVVEGHTDATGSVPKNEALSQSRAEAVRQYLLANSTVQADRITAMGFGATRPIASNDTAEGRAQNRRIDVIIQPQKPGR
ncbi:MAG: OmpA family protein [Desulfobacterales bacterium]|nr:OmpA family protein [Desulfobacterales bacterium]